MNENKSEGLCERLAESHKIVGPIDWGIQIGKTKAEENTKRVDFQHTAKWSQTQKVSVLEKTHSAFARWARQCSKAHAMMMVEFPQHPDRCLIRPTSTEEINPFFIFYYYSKRGKS